MKVAVLGYTQSGKTTVGNNVGNELIYGPHEQSPKDHYCYSVGDELVSRLAAIYGVDAGHVEEVKPALRHELWLIGRALEQEDPLILIRACLEKADVVCGIRTQDELVACVEAELFDLYIWVDRPEREARPEDGLTFNDLAHWTGGKAEFINNNGTLQDLQRNAIEAIRG